ncbi:DUF2637 domain-containing protein [Rhodococcus sp. NPDC003382]
MKAMKRRKNKNASAPANATTVSGFMWCAGIAITVVIGAAGFILSFIALRDLCIQAGQPREIAFLFPVIVDGTILQATMGVVSRRHDPDARRFFWKILIGAATVSIAGNAIHAVLTHAPGFNPVLAAVIATLPPISLLASTHALTVQGRRATSPTETVTETHTESAAEASSQHKTVDENATVPEARTENTDQNRATTETVCEAPAVQQNRTTTADTLTPQLEVPLAELLETHHEADPTPTFHSHEERREWALARRKAGIEVPVIAQEVDRSIATVYRWLSEADEPATI